MIPSSELTANLLPLRNPSSIPRNSHLYISEGTNNNIETWFSALEMFVGQQTEETQMAAKKALHQIRNKIVGHGRMKRHLVQKYGLLNIICQVLPLIDQEGFLEIASIIAYITSEEVCFAELQGTTIPKILSAQIFSISVNNISSKSLELLLRSLRNLYTNSCSGHGLALTREHLNFLSVIMGRSDLSKCQEHVSVIISYELERGDDIILTESLVARTVDLCLERNIPKSKIEALLTLLASLSQKEQQYATYLLGRNDILAFLYDTLRKEKYSCEIQLLVCLTISNILRKATFEKDQIDKKHPLVAQLIIPKLASFLESDSAIRIRSAKILAYLLSDNENLQLCFCDLNGVNHLRKILNEQKDSEEITSALFLLASLTSFREECRKKIVESNLIQILISFLGSSDEAIRIGSCQCIRGISRSVKNLRTCLMDAGVVGPLISLLKDPSDEVKKTSCAAICNLVLDFSPMKEMILKDDGFQNILSLSTDPNEDIRLNSLWALKNLLYMSESPIKQYALKYISINLLETWISDVKEEVQEQALNVLRNLLCERESDINAALKVLGESKLLKILETKLNSNNEEILVHTLYIIANICASTSAAPKNKVVENTVMIRALKTFIKPEVNLKLQMAALWCIINLTWTDDAGSTVRVEKLRSAGIEEKLQTLSRHPVSMELKERIHTALSNFSALALTQ